MERKNVHDIPSQSLRDRVLTGTIWITGNGQEPEKEATSSQSAAPFCSNRGTDEPPPPLPPFGLVLSVTSVLQSGPVSSVV